MNKLIPHFKKEDYILGFESQGNPFIFEDLVVREYMPNHEYLTVFDGKKLKILMPISTVKDTNALGLKKTSSDTQHAIDSLNKEIKSAWAELPQYKHKENFDLQDLEAMIKRLDAISRAYGYFDLHFWDSTYEKSKTDFESKKNIELIEGYKNKVRTEIGNIYFGEESYLEAILFKLSERFSIPKETLKKYSVNELKNLFVGMRVNDSTFNERVYFIFNKKANNEIDFYTGEEAQKIVTIFNSSEKDNKTVFKGKTAHSTGQTIRAKVRVISRDYGDEKKMQSEMASMEQGEILVSETTEPALMPAFKKASAVVTDVGGMLSHTAITARELNIPCIVGTESASKMLKNGDLVEVDTISGIVKIIN
jgi:phosphohistidine swiveling domain-containing protein